MQIEKAHNKHANVETNEDKINPNFLPLILIILEANKEPIAVPTTIKAVGNVESIIMLFNWDPIIPLSKTLTTGEVQEKVCPIDKINKFLLIIEIFYIDL